MRGRSIMTTLGRDCSGRSKASFFGKDIRNWLLRYVWFMIALYFDIFFWQYRSKFIQRFHAFHFCLGLQAQHIWFNAKFPNLWQNGLFNFLCDMAYDILNMRCMLLSEIWQISTRPISHPCHLHGNKHFELFQNLFNEIIIIIFMHMTIRCQYVQNHMCCAWKLRQKWKTRNGGRFLYIPGKAKGGKSHEMGQSAISSFFFSRRENDRKEPVTF